MSVKTTGAEYKEYMNYTDPIFWPEESFIDDVVLIIDGVRLDEHFDFDESKVSDSAEIIIECGVFMRNNDSDDIPLELHFKRWRKAQTTAYLSISVDKSRIDELKAILKTFGAKIA